MTSSATQFAYQELGERPPRRTLDRALTSQPSEQGQASDDQSGSEGFTPWVSEPEDDESPKLLYTADDLAAAVSEARQQASAEAEAATRQAMANDIEQRRCELMAAIGDQLEQQRGAFEEIVAAYALISQRLATALAKTIIPHALERCPLVDISEILKGSLSRLATEPSIEVRFSPDEAAAGEAILADITNQVGVSADVKSVADPAVVAGGVELRWQGGVIDHDWQTLYAEAFDVVAHWLGEGGETLTEDVRNDNVVTSSPEVSSNDPGSVDDSHLGKSE
ncbi:MAG: FliH/SctL family protein [Pseudomonadota bacterium]